jgi:hypothetical protein
MSQTPDLFATSVVLDTSALHGASVSGAPFQVLKGLVGAGLVNVYIPELALEEFRTQWRERHLGSAAQAQKSLKALSSESGLPDDLTTRATTLVSGLEQVDWEARSQQFACAYIQENGFRILPLTLQQCKLAWGDYFRGDLPSQKVKHRSDLPDAHILAAVREFASGDNQVSFVSADKGQREAATEFANVECFENLDSLVRSAKLTPALAKWQADQKWQALQAKLSFEEISEKVREFVQSNGAELLSSRDVTDAAIPEDNHTAQVLMHDEPEDLDLVGPEDWGGGLLRYQATFLSECLLSWAVYRGDAYSLPDWVSVSGEVNEHYLDAEGYAVVLVSVDVTVRVRVEDDDEGPAGSVTEISFEDGSLELSLGDYE